MTKAGFGFIVAGGFIYLAAVQSQIGWLYLFDAIIWGVIVLSAILPWHSLKSLQVEQEVLPSSLSESRLDGPREDETVEVKLKLTNKGGTKHFIKVLADCPFDQPEKRRQALFVTSLNRKSTTVLRYAAMCYRRGHYASSNIVLESSGPLGLIVWRRTFKLPLNLTVYPAYYQMEGLPAPGTMWTDWGWAIKPRAAGEFYGSREHQFGEPLKHIHWRNTARLARFMLKEFEEARHGPVIVAFETRQDFGTGKETTLEYSIKIAASLARLSADSGHSIDIISGDKPLRNAGWPEAMDYLARLETGGKLALTESMLALEPGGIVIVIVQTAEVRLIPTLLQLAKQIRGLVVLLEGFTPEEMPGEFTSRLRRSNLNVVNCAQGNLAAAIKELGNSLLSASKSAWM